MSSFFGAQDCMRRGIVRSGVTAIAAIAAVALAGCGGSGGGGAGEAGAGAVLPDASIGEDVALVIHLDGETMSPDRLRASAMAMLESIPEDSAEQRQEAIAKLDEAIAEYRPIYGELKSEGARAVTMAFAPPTDDSAVGEGEGVMLVRTDAGADLAAIRQSLIAFSETQGEPMPETVQIEKLDDTWGYFTGKTDEGQALRAPSGGSAEATAAFQDALDNVPGGAKLAFRMTSSLKAQAAENLQQAPPFLAGFTAPLQDLNFAVVGMSTGSSPTATAQMNFADEAAAEGFLNAWNGLLGFVKGMAQGQLSQMPDPPDPAVVEGVFSSLTMSQDGSTLSMTLDRAFLDHVAALAPTVGPAVTRPGGPF